MTLYLDSDGKTIRSHAPLKEMEPLGHNAMVLTQHPDYRATCRGIGVGSTIWVENGLGYYHPVSSAMGSGATLEELVEAAETVTIIWRGED